MKPARTPQCEHGNRHTKDDTGGLVPAPAPMGLARKVPCVECPLRRDSVPGFLGGYTPELYLEAMRSPASIACHLSPGFHERDIARQHHCTGIAAFRANVGYVCGGVGSPTGAHQSTRFVGHDEQTFFASDAEFYAHHKPGQEC